MRAREREREREEKELASDREYLDSSTMSLDSQTSSVHAGLPEVKQIVVAT